MRITIDEIECALNSIKIVLEYTEKSYYPEQFKTHKECLKEVIDIAHKYEKIQEIINNTDYIQEDVIRYQMICEVVEDGKID